MRNAFAPRQYLGVAFAVLVAAIFGIALVVLLLVQRTQRRSLAELLEAETRERSGMMTRVVELTGQSLRDFTYDYAQWDDMVTFLEAPRPEWAVVNLDASLKNFNLSAVWVLRLDGSLVYSAHRDNPPTPPALPLSSAELRQVLSAGKAVCFFVTTSEGLLELCFAGVRPSNDTNRVTAPRGWLVAARAWDATQLRLIGDVMQCETAITPPAAALPPPQANQISLSYPLHGADGAPVAQLVYTFRSQESEIVARWHRVGFGLFAGTFLLTAVIAVAFVFHWMVRPLQLVGESLQARDAGRILPLVGRRDEVGRVAQALKTAFAEHAALAELIEGRTRLGRELHDGVIQTVYAAGMSLAGARSVLRENPAEAERVLDATRAELNASIRNLRDFINGLEPEPLQQWSFRDAVQSVIGLMQGVRRVTSTLQIDNDLAGQLTGRQRLHLLQITREAISNSVRHGQAEHLTIVLQREATDAVLEIVDDGVGLQRGPRADGGHGLPNLAARARELGGTMQLIPIPEGGLRIRVVVPVFDDKAGGAG